METYPNYRAAQHLVERAKQYLRMMKHKETPIFLPVLTLPEFLFGRYVHDLKESSLAVDEFIEQADKVWFEIIPDFRLQLLSLHNALRKQNNY